MDVDLHDAAAAVRGVLTPEHGGQPLGAHRAIALQQQRGQQHPRLVTGQPHGTRRRAHLERTENPELQAHAHATARLRRRRLRGGERIGRIGAVPRSLPSPWRWRARSGPRRRERDGDSGKTIYKYARTAFSRCTSDGVLRVQRGPRRRGGSRTATTGRSTPLRLEAVRASALVHPRVGRRRRPRLDGRLGRPAHRRAPPRRASSR